MNKETFVADFLAHARPGRTGWKERAAAAAEIAWEAEAERAAEARRAELFAHEQAHIEAERATPAWRVVEEWGTHSFSSQLFGAHAAFGGGTMTYEDALAEAERIKNSPRCRKAAAFWDFYMK